MADTERARRIRHTHETNSLSYGHFGTATYVSEHRSWSFLRQTGAHHLSDPDTHSGFQLVHERISQLGRLPDVDHEPGWHGPVTRNALLKQIPDVALLSKQLLSSNNTLESGISEPSGEGTHCGNRLAFGSVRLPVPVRSYDAVPAHAFAAFTTGQNGENVQLIDLAAEYISWNNDQVLRETCRVPCLSARTSPIWSNCAEKIQHLVGAGLAFERFLIVKASGTSILEPIVAGDKSDEDRSFVKPSPVATIPLSRTGESPHAHAAFNPHDSNLVAIVDDRGQWSTWKVQGRRARSVRILYTVALQGSNYLRSFTASRSDHGIFDGWHRICWVADAKGFHRLLVCGRRFAAVFDSRGGFEGQVDMRLGPSSDGNQILDVRQSTVRPELTFALTTARLFIFNPTPASDSVSSGAQPLRLECSWKHFRGDLGLKMTCLETAHGMFHLFQLRYELSFPDTWVLLYSRSSPLAVVYHFGHELQGLKTVSLQDPSVLELPRVLQDETDAIEDIGLYPVESAVQGVSTDHTGYALMRMILRTSNGRIIEATYKQKVGRDHNAKRVPMLPLPTAATGRSQSSRHIEVDDMEDFIVPDGDEKDEAVALHKATFRGHEKGQLLPMHMRNWQRLLDPGIFLPMENSMSPINISLESAFEQFKTSQPQSDLQPMDVMSQLVDGYNILDLEEESELVTTWLTSLEKNENMSIQIIGEGLDPLDHSSYDNLLAIYEQLSLAYIGSLGSKVKDRNRVNRERLVRQVVADVFLGNMIVRSKNAAADPTSSNPVAARTDTNLPSSPPQVASDSPAGLSNQPSASQSPSAEEEPILTRLRGYCSFRGPVPPLSLSEHSTVSNILAHLPNSIEEDPAHYSYQGTNQQLKLAQEETAAQSTDPQDRRKAMRQAARLQRKLERTTQKSQEVSLQRKMLPTVASLGTRAGMPIRQIQSSQAAAPTSSQAPNSSQVGIPGLTMTQPERGAFGMRPVQTKAKGKRVRRKAGF